jgi:hypothetical protein
MIWRTLLSLLLAPFALVASWLGGRKSAQTDIKLEAAERNIKVVQQAEVIEDEVEALSPDALKSRSRKWVRTTTDR